MTENKTEEKEGFKCYRILVVVVVLFLIFFISSTTLYARHNGVVEDFSIIAMKADFTSASPIEKTEMPTGKRLSETKATQKKTPSILVTLSTMKLPKFNESFRNPCWYDFYNHRTTLKCFPYVYLGGFAKSGTTDLFSRISAHPLLIAGLRKETYFFIRDYLIGTIRPKCSSNFHCASVYYSEYFFGEAARMISMTKDTRLLNSDFLNAAEKNPPSSPQVKFMKAFPRESLAIWNQGQKLWKYPGITVDATSTMVSEHGFIEHFAENLGTDIPRNTSADWIRKIYPGSKFIMILRNPALRAYSDHLMRFTRRKMTPYAKEFHQRMLQTTREMNNCLQRSGSLSPLLCTSHKFNGHLDTGLYYYHIKTLLERFPREQMLFLRFEDYTANMPQALAKVFKFLDLPAISQEGLEFISKSSKAQNAGTFDGKMFPETMDLLNNFYKPHNEKLANLLGDDRYLWNEH